VGNTFVACALAHQACRYGASVLYFRLPRLLQELTLARGDGRFTKLLAQLAKTDLLVLDDWPPLPMWRVAICWKSLMIATSCARPL